MLLTSGRRAQRLVHFLRLTLIFRRRRTIYFATRCSRFHGRREEVALMASEPRSAVQQPVYDGRFLHFREDARLCQVAVDSPGWFGWLRDPKHVSFLWRTPAGAGRRMMTGRSGMSRLHELRNLSLRSARRTRSRRNAWMWWRRCCPTRQRPLLPSRVP